MIENFFGLSCVYTFLGIFSSLTGSIFGMLTKFAPVQFIAAAIFGLMGFFLLRSRIKCGTNTVNFGGRWKGFAGAFVLGILSGLVVGGCTFPVLGTILVLMVFNKSLFIGGLLLFVFSLGIGTLFIVVAVLGKSFLAGLSRQVK